MTCQRRRQSPAAHDNAAIADHRIYVQPIDYPTVSRGTERLRLPPNPLHGDADIETLVVALGDVWRRLTLQKAA